MDIYPLVNKHCLLLVKVWVVRTGTLSSSSNKTTNLSYQKCSTKINVAILDERQISYGRRVQACDKCISAIHKGAFLDRIKTHDMAQVGHNITDSDLTAPINISRNLLLTFECTKTDNITQLQNHIADRYAVIIGCTGKFYMCKIHVL